VRRIEHVERQRWAAQLQRLEAALTDDARALAEAERSERALAFVVAQGRRDASRLRAALAGRTPSAVVGRDDPPGLDDEATRLRLARDEAAHAADNVLAFLRRVNVDGPRPEARDEAMTRAARWLLRLHLEDADAAPTDAQGFRDLALALLTSDANVRPTVVAMVEGAVQRRVDALRSLLTDGPSEGDDRQTLDYPPPR
jgi:hypothetical protein